MSLTAILKQVDRVNDKQRQVQLRYNKKSRGCPRQSDLINEAEEDRRIYGYSHSEILQMFKHSKAEDMQQTRPSTACQLKVKTTRKIATAKKNDMRRVQSATKSFASYKQQYNFLFKEDIFDENHQKMRHSIPLTSQNGYKQQKMKKLKLENCKQLYMLNSQYVKKQFEKSIKVQRMNFVKTFNQNLNRIQNKNRVPLTKVNKNKIVYQKRDSNNNKMKLRHVENEEFDDLFLTKPISQKQNIKKFKLVLTSSVDNIKQMKCLIHQLQEQKFHEMQRAQEYGKSLSLFQTNFLTLLPSKFILICVDITTLLSVKLKLMIQNNEIILEQSKEVINLPLLISQLQQKIMIIHLCFYEQDHNLLYEQFLLNKSLSYFKNKQNQMVFLTYFLKKFLLFDSVVTLKSAEQSSDLLLKSNVDIPDEFQDFIQNLGMKLCKVYDKDCRLYVMNLRYLLCNGLESILAFKKEMGFGSKVVKLKTGTRSDFKKYMYNWEYFYICFFLSLNYNLCQIRIFQFFNTPNIVVSIIVISCMKAQKNQSVKVALRVRPLNKRQTQLNSPLCVQTKDNILSIKKGADIKDFVFDYVYGIQTKQSQIYQTCGYSLVQNALDGFNGTIFAYGQTGAGKTFTMVGHYKDPEWKGIIPRGFDHVITAIQTSQSRKYIVRASFIEIYNQEIFDLLDMKGDVKKDLKQSPQTGVFIKDLKCVPVKSSDEMFKLLDYGNINRTVAKTNMNATSSRSHALFTVHIESVQGEGKIKGSKLNFVDLAGSQRQGKTGATGDTLKEGAKINLSLTALGNVINSLVDGKKGGHIPYRDSKLTRLLQDSLGGNTKTLMCASISPAEDNYDETVSTLRYAARARNIKNTPKVNEDPKDTLIKEYMAEIQKLRKQLTSGGMSEEITETSEQLLKELERAREKEQQLTQKQSQLLEMKLKMKEMQQLIMKKQKDTPEMIEKAKKRKLQKKKNMKNEEINENKVLELEQQQKQDLEQTKVSQDKQNDIQYWKNLAKRLKKKIKKQVEDKKDLCAQFEDQRQRLNQCIRNIEGNLSFYKQVAEKFLSESDLSALKDLSVFNYENRQMAIPPFLLHDEKLTLPKTLKRNEVDDLWKEKRKGYKLQVVNQSLPQLSNNSNIFQRTPQSKSTVFDKNYKQSTTSPLLQNRRILKYINYQDEKYKQKDLNVSHETFFRRTNFAIRQKSSSQNKRPPSSSQRINSRTKLQSLGQKEKKEQTSQERRPLSKGREKLEPIRK